jgi:hypothetical protein
MKFSVALLAGLLAASPAFAQNEPASVTADHGAGNAANDARHTGDTNARGEPLICRTQSSSSTSRMASRRVCRTAAEWREISRSSND